ncbi:MAG: tellurite resistance protein [Deferribacteres bacterium]|nr:tellurite resistance protein [Deferribacteres bacterium]
MSENSCVKFLPVSVFATVMGLMGVTLAFERVGKIFHLNVHSVYVLLLVIVNIWFLFLSGTYLLKFLKFPEEVRKDFSHPVKLNFIPTFSISLILFSIGYFEISKTVSLIYWISGVIIHMLLLFYIINKWFFHDFKINVKNPAWFIPVVGPILAPISGAAFSIEVSWFFYSIGIVLWLPIFSILLYRVIFNDPLPPKLLPTLFIMIAPPAVGFISYIKLSQQLDNFSRVLFWRFCFYAPFNFLRKIFKTSIFSVLVGLYIPYGCIYHQYSAIFSSDTFCVFQVFCATCIYAYAGSCAYCVG